MEEDLSAAFCALTIDRCYNATPVMSGCPFKWWGQLKRFCIKGLNEKGHLPSGGRKKAEDLSKALRATFIKKY